MSESDDQPSPREDAPDAAADAVADGFERIFNPYIIGNPIRGGEPFFGREDDFAFVARRLEAERSGIVLLFAGARRSGKTSIMFQILDGRLGDAFLPVFIDMQQLAGIDGDGQMLGRIARIVIDSVGDDRIVAEYYVFDDGNPILTFDRLLADINQIFPDKRLLLLVDEAELLRDKVARGDITSAILTFMASALESRRVSYFFTGSSHLAEADVAEWRRLMGKGDFKEISFLSPKDTARLATEPVDDRVQHAEGVLTAIYQLTYGHPFYTQLICTNAVDHLNSHRRYDMTAADLDEVVGTIVNNPPPQLVYDWEQFSHEEQLVLSLLSEVSDAPHVPVAPEALLASIEENEYPININSSDLHVTLEVLNGRMVLERSDDGGYHFLVDLVRLWVRRNRSVWRLVEEQAAQAPRRSHWKVVAGVGAVLLLVAAAAVLTREAVQVTPVAVPAAPMVGSVWLEEFPDGTQVELRGPLDGEGETDVQRRDKTPTLIDGRRPGAYEVVFTHPLYARRVDTVQVTAGRRDTVRAGLQRLVGQLTVAAVQPQARIRVTNAVEGFDTTTTGNLVVSALPTGTYQLEVACDGFRPWAGQVQVESGVDAQIRPDLNADVGALFVISTPPAMLYVDDRQVGTTPRGLDALHSGRHQLRLELPDYQPHKETRNVHFGQQDTLAVALVLQPASLTLRSTPSGARILIDGTALPDTITPAAISRPPGTYRVRLELDGYDTHETVLELTPGGSHLSAPALVQQFGYVKITRPLFGTLVIDGVRGKEGPLGTQTLSVGSHHLQLEGYEESHDVEVVNGKTIPIQWEK